MCKLQTDLLHQLGSKDPCQTYTECLKLYIVTLIHLDQAGFVPSREALTIIDYARKKQVPLCCLAVDTEKVFDRFNRNFLFAVLRRAGMPINFDR